MRERLQKAPGALVLIGTAITLTLLAQCGDGVDERRAAQCRRTVPALVPPDSTINLLRVGLGPASDSIRVDYRLGGRPDTASKARWVICGFGPGANLNSVTTEDGPVAGASVYLLKRYFLDTPEAEAADPRGQ